MVTGVTESLGFSNDNFNRLDYAGKMAQLLRTLIFSMLVAFATSSAVHATAATTISLKMALADGGAMEMSDCTDCDMDMAGDAAGAACELACSAPFVADLVREIPLTSRHLDVYQRSSPHDFVGRTSPPEPYPPRTLV